MNFRSPLVTAALLATSVLTVSCGRQAPLTVSPEQMHLRAHGDHGDVVLQEQDYQGLYYKNLIYDPHCAATVAVQPRPRKRGEPAHVDVTPVHPGTCQMLFFDDHGSKLSVNVVVDSD